MNYLHSVNGNNEMMVAIKSFINSSSSSSSSHDKNVDLTPWAANAADMHLALVQLYGSKDAQDIEDKIKTNILKSRIKLIVILLFF
jgi:hypothetical protein